MVPLRVVRYRFVRLIFFFFGILAPDFRAMSSAIATACLRGRPALISDAIFLEIVFRDLPFFSGTSQHPTAYQPVPT